MKLTPMTQNGERFMVDFQIYKELHRDSLRFQMLYKDDDDDDDDDEDSDDRVERRMSSDEMESETPPSGPNIYVFPGTVPGYNLRSKKWGKGAPCAKRSKLLSDDANKSDANTFCSGSRGGSHNRRQVEQEMFR